MIVFDLDGCLINSRTLIVRSYREAGIEPPGDFMTFGHHNWTGDEAAHERKDTAYLRRLAAGPVRALPPWHTALLLATAGYELGMLTGAPPGTVGAVTPWLQPWPFTAALDGLKPSQKHAWMAAAGHGVYVDDQTYVKVPEGWRFVHYVGQNTQELYRQVTD